MAGPISGMWVTRSALPEPCRSPPAVRVAVGDKGCPNSPGSRLAAGAAVQMPFRPHRPQRLRWPAPRGRAAHRRSIPAASAVTGDVDRRPLWPCHDARTARTADDDAARRAFAPNHAIAGSHAAAPLQTPQARIPDQTRTPMEHDDPVVSGSKRYSPRAANARKEAAPKRHGKD